MRPVLYTTPDCPLCDEARAMLGRIGVAFDEASDPSYAERVPVLTLGGRVIGEGVLRERAIVRALRRAARSVETGL